MLGNYFIHYMMNMLSFMVHSLILILNKVMPLQLKFHWIGKGHQLLLFSTHFSFLFFFSIFFFYYFSVFYFFFCTFPLFVILKFFRTQFSISTFWPIGILFQNLIFQNLWIPLLGICPLVWRVIFGHGSKKKSLGSKRVTIG